MVQSATCRCDVIIFSNILKIVQLEFIPRIKFQRVFFFRQINDQKYLEHFLCRESIVDLVGRPGDLCEPDSSINGPSSISISSPLHPPNSGSCKNIENWRSIAQHYFLECQSLNIMFSDLPGGSFPV